MKLIVGLGNPGQTYANDRHNVGFMCINHFAKANRIPLDMKKGNARIGMGEVDGIPLVLARPQTYMNASGEAVRALLKKLKVNTEDLIVIHDDLDLPLGRIRVRKGGSSGGHNGIQSIIRETGSADFIRVRIGIGRPARAEDAMRRGKDVIDYVLTDFTPEERRTIDEALPKATEALHCLISEGLVAAMNRHNPSPHSPDRGRLKSSSSDQPAS
ncbi:MAG: aminoacyl-tRNA hydrolase [Chloroflexi bacterium RBG_16_57_8]|nr:MAG: aminoacyl-tRNA hydrolase [Chloroflexi bacterium RBG_16_57_8]